MDRLSTLPNSAGSSAEALWDYIRDAAQGVTSAARKVAQFGVDVEGKAVQLILDIGGELVQAGNWVVHTAEEAWHAIVGCFNWIETKIEDLIDWLKALFKFSDIMDTAHYFESLRASSRVLGE